MISIVMPVYNTPADWFEQSVLSCLNQTLQQFELIIVDNESDSKETLSVLKRVQNIDKIKIVSSPRQKDKRNVAVAINTGIKNSKYEFIARMDSDDWMYPERLEKQVNYLKDNPDVYVVGAQMKIIQTKQVTNHPQVLTSETIRYYDTGWFINHPTVMLRKKLFDKIGYYTETPVYFPEDYELWSRCLAKNIKIANMSECLLNYNRHGQNTSSVDVQQQWLTELNLYRNRFL
jgi:glycosyltransferase involved in cell wall biosynthesis